MDRICPSQNGTMTFQKVVLSSLSLLVGATGVLVSLKVLQSDPLQIDHYLTQLIKRETNHYPIELLTASILSLTFGLGQVIFSLMFFVGEVGWRGWSWMNLCLFFVYALSTFLVASKNHTKGESINFLNIFQTCSTFHTILLINVGLSFTSILHSILMLHVQSKYVASTTSRRWYYSD